MYKKLKIFSLSILILKSLSAAKNFSPTEFKNWLTPAGWTGMAIEAAGGDTTNYKKFVNVGEQAVSIFVPEYALFKLATDSVDALIEPRSNQISKLSSSDRGLTYDPTSENFESNTKIKQNSPNKNTAMQQRPKSKSDPKKLVDVDIIS
jgi:hypothetical protein